ncbi:MAG: NYN domain-containing protein [Candidatus Hodarchaeales archaeon]|jgi:hypothetical protein
MTKFRCPICRRTVRNINDHIARFHPEDSLLGKKRDNQKITISVKRKHTKVTNREIIIVDGQNVANYGKRSRPTYKNIYLVFSALKTKGYEPKIVVSAALKYKIDNPVKLNKMLDKGVAIESPAGENDDLSVLELAQTYNAKIITNDRYLDHEDLFPSVIKKIIKFQILNREVIFRPLLY